MCVCVGVGVGVWLRACMSVLVSVSGLLARGWRASFSYMFVHDFHCVYTCIEYCTVYVLLLACFCFPCLCLVRLNLFNSINNFKYIAFFNQIT